MKDMFHVEFNRKILIPLFLIIIFVSISSISCSDHTGSIQIQNWQVLYDEGKSLASVSFKNGWQNISELSNMKLPQSDKKEIRYLWLKSEFEIEGDPDKFFGLSTGGIRYCEDIYINNSLEGSFPIEKVNWNPLPRNYNIGKGILKKGKK